jgi:hypothetical protein
LLSDISKKEIEEREEKKLLKKKTADLQADGARASGAQES